MLTGRVDFGLLNYSVRATSCTPYETGSEEVVDKYKEKDNSGLF